MRILLAHNFHLVLDPHSVAEGRPYPPLGTLVLASMLERAGHEVAFWDATFHHDPADFALGLDGVRPDRVAIVADHHAVPQKMCLTAQREAALTMIRLARERGLDVLITGPDATDRPALYLEGGATVVIRGEPDRSVVAWADGTPAAALPGAVVDAGAPIPTPAPPMADLSDLPPPAWDRIDLLEYARRWRSRHGAWEAPVSTTRGCPYRCNWCAKPIWGRGASIRPVEAVVAEMRDLGARGADRIWITDDIFGLKRSWLRAFREAVEAADGIPPYRCLSRADLLVHEATVGDLARSGCVEVWIGAESGSQRVLDAMDKDQRVEEIVTATGLLRRHGIRVGFFLQLGYPGERLDDVLSTLQMVRSLAPDEIGVSVSYPLPGTPFHDAVRDRMHATNWESAMDNALLFESDYPQDFYGAAREAIRSTHALRRAAAAAARIARGTASWQDLRRLAATARHAPSLPLHHVRMRRIARARDRQRAEGVA